MKQFVHSAAIDSAPFLGVMLGFVLLFASMSVDGWRMLAIPGVIVLLPSLIYGMR